MKKTRLTEQAREKWLKVMVNENLMMSPEESGDEDKVIVHPLPWRTDYVNKMFHKNRQLLYRKEESSARRQMKERANGLLSTRAAPSSMPSWSVIGN